jgi:hypothetical protein
MRIPTMQLAKLTEIEVKDVSHEQERENESRRLKELMMRLQTMISLSEGEQCDCPQDAA